MAPRIYNTESDFLPTTAQSQKILEEPPASNTENVFRAVKQYLDLYSSQDYRHIHPTNERLEAAMRAELKTRNISSRWLERTVHLAASLIELAFHGCSFEEKKTIALYNWYIIYIDEAVLVDPQPCAAFQQRFIRGLPQFDPVLDAFADVLHTLLATYPPLQSNLILSASFEFITATCVEPQLALAEATTPRVSQLKHVASTRFPLFLRERTGLGIPGAMMLFSPSQTTNFVNCFQALGDMTFWIAAVNDLLSFFKEELAGETATYIHIRAVAEGRSPFCVLAALKDELCTASRNIARTLAADPAAADTWRMFEYGVVAWHLENDRYRLHELDQTSFKV